MDQKDLKQIKELFSEEFDLQEKRLDKKIALMIKAEMDIGMGKMEQKMFDWKSDIVNAVDTMAKEIRDEREFRDISGHQTADNTRRIGKLEQKVFGVAES